MLLWWLHIIMSVSVFLLVFMRPTFVQVWAGFGLVTEALAASVSSSTGRASWRDVTASSGHPRCGPGKSVRERDQEEETQGKKKNVNRSKHFITVTEGEIILDNNICSITETRWVPPGL